MVNYFSEADMEGCLDSFQRHHPGLECQLIIVDNGSGGDRLSQTLRRLDGRINLTLIKNEENIGFAKGCNQGFARSRGAYILLLNPDILFVEDSIRRMIDFMNHHPHVGVVGCRQVLPSGRHYVGDAGYHPSLAKAFNHSFFLSRLFPGLFKGVYLIRGGEPKEPIDVDWVSGGCFLFRKELLERAGRMNESFFLYAEDMEWCRRVRECGWQVAYVPFTHVIHKRRHHPKGSRAVIGLRSQRALFRHDHGTLSTLLFEAVTLSGLVLRSLAYSLLHILRRNPEYRHQAREVLRSILAYSRQVGVGKK